MNRRNRKGKEKEYNKKIQKIAVGDKWVKLGCILRTRDEG